MAYSTALCDRISQASQALKDARKDGSASRIEYCAKKLDELLDLLPVPKNLTRRG